jgi:hypothetical protein
VLSIQGAKVVHFEEIKKGMPLAFVVSKMFFSVLFVINLVL